MRILRITLLYKTYIDYFYRKNPGLKKAPYQQQMDSFYYDHFSWGDGYKKAFESQGVDYADIYTNVGPLQRRWAREQGIDGASLQEIAVRQAERFSPEVLFFNHNDENLLRHIRETAPGIRLVLGYSGSAVVNDKILKSADVVISCAPEIVSLLRRQGQRAEQIHHAFNPDVLDRLGAGAIPQPREQDIIFIGQLIPQDQFHIRRIEILQKLCSSTNVMIYYPEGDSQARWNRALKTTIYHLVRGGQRIGIPDSFFNKIPKVRRIIGKSHAPRFPVMKKPVRGAIYGLDMFRTIQRSRITLNIHADSSPTHASNIRMFEIAGSGSCLLTDWKTNLNDLFADGRECVSFKTAAEAAEKADWLLTHPDECRRIAEAGQKRVLKDHTFVQRARQLLEIIQKSI